MPEAMRAMALRALDALLSPWRDGRDVYWRDDPTARGTHVGEIASKLGIAPMSDERTVLQDALSRLAETRLLRYEYQRDADTKIRWFMTDAGVAALRLHSPT